MRPERRHLVGWAGTVRSVLWAGAVVLATFCLAVIAAAPASAGPYVNPAPAEIRAKLHAAAVARSIPPKILYGIAFQESTWRQFDADGDPLIGFDGKGIGIMQVTTVPAGVDVERLKTDLDYNIAVGADILVAKWGYAPTVFPFIGDGDPRCYENWFFAVWAYNGWVAGNAYPYRIWTHIATGPEGWWTGLAVTSVPRASLVKGFPVAPVTTPVPAHYWSPTPLPKPTLGAPRVQKRVAVGERFTVSGTLSPRHPAGAVSVELRLSRWNGSAWVLRRRVLATNRDFGEVTRYAATLSLGKAGRWRIVAHSPADADHAAATAPPAYVTTR